MDNNLKAQQRTAAIGALAATVVTIILFFLLLAWSPFSTPKLSTLTDKLVFALRWNIFPLFMLFLGIGVVANKRFLSSAIDPLAGAETRTMKIHLNYINNSLEFYLLFLVTTLVLASFLPAAELQLIPILSILYVIARIIFWIGYLMEPCKRACGMFMTELIVYIPFFYDCYRVTRWALGH